MSDGTGISWTDATWPVTTGCEAVSPGCDHCFAARLTSGRLKHVAEYAGLAENGKFTGEVRCHPHRLDWPLRWRKPRRVFVASMSDLFHEDVPDSFIAEVWDVMRRCPQHVFQVLTKRHARMRSLMPSIEADLRQRERDLALVDCPTPLTWPLPNVWLGVSVEDQRWADIRVPALLETSAAVRWLSVEPLLGPVDLDRLACPCGRRRWVDDENWQPDHPGQLRGPQSGRIPCGFCNEGGWYEPDIDRPGLDWLVCGGESGRDHRPMDLGWLESLVDQCDQAGVPVFVKQDSGPKPGKQGRIPDEIWARKEYPGVAAR